LEQTFFLYTDKVQELIVEIRNPSEEAFFNYAQEIQHMRVCSQIGAYLVEVAYLHQANGKTIWKSS